MSMNTVLQKITRVAGQSNSVLLNLDNEGDDSTMPRQVNFDFICQNEKKADAVASTLTDFQFDQTTVLKQDDRYSVEVVITMPATPDLMFCVSGFMACVAELHSIDFDGWGCFVQRTSK